MIEPNQFKIGDEWGGIENYTRHLSQINGCHLPSEGLDSKKFYVVPMLPYPSGKLHAGHIRNYAIADIMFRRAKTTIHNSFMPMGWDAFGLPAENAALIHNIAPSDWIRSNIRQMKEQMKAVSLSIDWRGEIVTSSPQYYCWNQLLFLGMKEGGIVRRERAVSNWDPVDQTALSNEQVINGRGWRSGAYVIRRKVETYFLLITNFIRELTLTLPKLFWPQNVKLMQKNWIGRHLCFERNLLGAFLIDGESAPQNALFTSTSSNSPVLVISSDHHAIPKIMRPNPKIRRLNQLWDQTATQTTILSACEHVGIKSGFWALEPNQNILSEVWVGRCGGIVSDNRNLNSRFVFMTSFQKKPDLLFFRTNSILDSETAAPLPKASQLNAIGGGFFNRTLSNLNSHFSSELQDWSVSRQRSWGTPIPTSKCLVCNIVSTDSTTLPTLLSQAKKRGSCSNCYCETEEERDTLDTFFDSSWYFLRYPCSNNINSAVDTRTNYWLPIDLYVGGIEHSVLHLMYSRFVLRALQTVGVLRFSEPIKKLVVQGMVLSEAFYSRTLEGGIVWLNASKAQRIGEKGCRVFSAGKCKMSKSKKNGCDIKCLITKHGADAVRLFIITSSPLNKSLIWNEEGLGGATRFLQKCFDRTTMPSPHSYCNNKCAPPNANFIRLEKKMSDDFENLDYHNILSSLIQMADTMPDCHHLNQHCYGLKRNETSRLLGLSYPIIPNLTSIIWRRALCHTRWGALPSCRLLNNDSTIHSPSFEQTAVLTIQIDGKTKKGAALKWPSQKRKMELWVGWEGLLLIRPLTFGHLRNIKKVVVFAEKIVNVVMVC
ncbi:leucyl-tRNA synthetase [Candidatus Tremblaya phenacola PAVE]|nr:leucyl-tRNA synthetase [Candidatus Tremblaya phenacola PAVE]